MPKYYCLVVESRTTQGGRRASPPTSTCPPLQPSLCRLCAHPSLIRFLVCDSLPPLMPPGPWSACSFLSLLRPSSPPHHLNSRCFSPHGCCQPLYSTELQAPEEGARAEERAARHGEARAEGGPPCVKCWLMGWNSSKENRATQKR